MTESSAIDSIKVNRLDGVAVSVDAMPDSSVRQLRHHVSETISVPISRIRLVVGAEVLSDDKLVDDIIGEEVTLVQVPEQCAIVGGRSGNLFVCGLSPLECVATLEGHRDTVGALSVDFTLLRAISGGADGFLRVWDIGSGFMQCLGVLAGHRGSVTCVTANFRDNRALSASCDGSLRMWDTQALRCMVTLSPPPSGFLFALAADLDSPDKRALCGTSSGVLHLLDLDSGGVLATLSVHRCAIFAVSADFRKSRALSSSADCTLRFWDLDAMVCIAVVRESTRPFESLSVDFELGYAVGAASGNLCMWDLNTKVVTHITPSGVSGKVTGICADFKTKTAVVISSGGELCVLSLEDGACENRLKLDSSLHVVCAGMCDIISHHVM